MTWDIKLIATTLKRGVLAYIPTINPILQLWFFQAQDISVPVVSLRMAQISIWTSCRAVEWFWFFFCFRSFNVRATTRRDQVIRGWEQAMTMYYKVDMGVSCKVIFIDWVSSKEDREKKKKRKDTRFVNKSCTDGRCAHVELIMLIFGDREPLTANYVCNLVSFFSSVLVWHYLVLKWAFN